MNVDPKVCRQQKGIIGLNKNGAFATYKKWRGYEKNIWTNDRRKPLMPTQKTIR